MEKNNTILAADIEKGKGIWIEGCYKKRFNEQLLINKYKPPR